jgi:hypothetical protein
MIKRFKEFNDSNETLRIFDFDDTLVVSPDFNELAIQFLKEDVSIKDLLELSVKRLGVSLNDLKWQDGRIYVEDPQQQIRIYGNWVRKGNRVYLTSPDLFYISDISLPKELKELSELYKSVENKCIVTAREESLRSKVSNKLQELGLELPKYGLHMAPVGTKNAGHWKGEMIVEILKDTGFKKAVFYDDNQRYIKKASKVVTELMPNVDWTTIKVQK